MFIDTNPVFECSGAPYRSGTDNRSFLAPEGALIIHIQRFYRHFAPDGAMSGPQKSFPLSFSGTPAHRSIRLSRLQQPNVTGTDRIRDNEQHE